MVQLISRMECMLSCGVPISGEKGVCVKCYPAGVIWMGGGADLPTVRKARLAESMGPMVDPHGLSFLTTTSCKKKHFLLDARMGSMATATPPAEERYTCWLSP